MKRWSMGDGLESAASGEQIGEAFEEVFPEAPNGVACPLPLPRRR